MKKTVYNLYNWSNFEANIPPCGNNLYAHGDYAFHKLTRGKNVSRFILISVSR